MTEKTFKRGFVFVVVAAISFMVGSLVFSIREAKQAAAEYAALVSNIADTHAKGETVYITQTGDAGFSQCGKIIDCKSEDAFVHFIVELQDGDQLYLELDYDRKSFDDGYAVEDKQPYLLKTTANAEVLSIEFLRDLGRATQQAFTLELSSKGSECDMVD